MSEMPYEQPPSASAYLSGLIIDVTGEYRETLQRKRRSEFDAASWKGQLLMMRCGTSGITNEAVGALRAIELADHIVEFGVQTDPKPFSERPTIYLPLLEPVNEVAKELLLEDHIPQLAKEFGDLQRPLTTKEEVRARRLTGVPDVDILAVIGMAHVYHKSNFSKQAGTGEEHGLYLHLVHTALIDSYTGRYLARLAQLRQLKLGVTLGGQAS